LKTPFQLPFLSSRNEFYFHVYIYIYIYIYICVCVCVCLCLCVWKCLPNIFGPVTIQYYRIRPRFHLGGPGWYDPRGTPNYVDKKAKPVFMIQRIELTQDRNSLLRSHNLIHFLLFCDLFNDPCISSKCTAE